MFLNLFFYKKNSTSVHAERAKPVLASRNPLCFIDRSKASCSLHAAPNLSKPIEVFPRPSKLAGRSPTPMEERNRGSTDSNVILPPPLGPPSHSTFEPPSLSPYEVFVQRRGQFGIREISHIVNVHFLRLNFRAEVCSGSYHPSDSMSWIQL